MKNFFQFSRGIVYTDTSNPFHPYHISHLYVILTPTYLHDSKIPKEVLSSEEMMQLLALSATRIEHMQVHCTCKEMLALLCCSCL